MLGMYLLYLRVSGTFHLIVGLLLMFGFNLPETHHLYYLATSFTDFWRRINIYWKDFVMKLFFYPTHFKLRKMGTLWALSVATLATFLATWLLHSWQWFWIRGRPLFDWKDFSFWIILGVLVLVTAIYETTRGRKRTLTTVPGDSAATVHTGITSSGSLFFDVYSLGLLVMSVVGGVPNTDGCCFETNTSRSDNRFRRAGVDLRLRDGVGVVEPRNLRRARHSRQLAAPFRFWPSAASKLRLARYVFWLFRQ